MEFFPLRWVIDRFKIERWSRLGELRGRIIRWSSKKHNKFSNDGRINDNTQRLVGVFSLNIKQFEARKKFQHPISFERRQMSFKTREHKTKFTTFQRMAIIHP